MYNNTKTHIAYDYIIKSHQTITLYKLHVRLLCIHFTTVVAIIIAMVGFIYNYHVYAKCWQLVEAS